MMTRREALGILAAAPAVAQKPPKLKVPSLCVLSKALTGVGYAEMGEIVKQLGFDGIDITVMPGGLVEPSLAPVDEVRAFESIHGSGLEAPVVTTGLTTPYDPWCRTVLALAGRTGVGLAKCGLNRSNLAAQSRREAAGLVYAGREYKIAVLVIAGASGVEMSLQDARSFLAVLDPEWSGLALRSNVFAEGSGVTDDQIRGSLSQVKAVIASDFAEGRTREPRPLGQGSVDFSRMFGLLARAGFSGPVTVERAYKTSDEPGALAKDAEFARKQIQTAYTGVKT